MAVDRVYEHRSALPDTPSGNTATTVAARRLACLRAATVTHRHPYPDGDYTIVLGRLVPGATVDTVEVDYSFLDGPATVTPSMAR